MFEELIIWGPQVADEHDTLAELSEKDRAYLAKELEGLDNKWGITLNRTSYVNSYQNDDCEIQGRYKIHVQERI